MFSREELQLIGNALAYYLLQWRRSDLDPYGDLLTKVNGIMNCKAVHPGPGTEAVQIIDDLLHAMDRWGGWEDGIPAEFSPLIAQARKYLGAQAGPGEAGAT